MQWMVYSVCYLDRIAVNKMLHLLNEASLNVTSSFRSLLLFHVYISLIGLLSDIVASEGFFLAWNPLFISRYRCSDCQFPGFGECMFLQLLLRTLIHLVMFNPLMYNVPKWSNTL